MRLTHRITILVAVQISIIAASSAILVHFESQTNLTGNMVNVAGKNRLLTGMVVVNVNHAVFHTTTRDNNVHDSLDDLRENIHFLKSGGIHDGIEISPLPSQFTEEWNDIAVRFAGFESATVGLLQDGPTMHQIEEIETMGNNLVVLSDRLTESLGRYVERLSDQTIYLQMALAMANIATHIVMIALVWRIFNRHAHEMRISERFAAAGRIAATLAHDLRNPLGTINNSAEIIKAGSGHEASRRECTRIKRSVGRISDQIERILECTKDLQLDTDTHSVGQILELSLETVRVPAHIELSLPDHDATVYCDAGKMESVFANILLNAVQAMGKDPGRIAVNVQDGSDETRISFENSGPSIGRKDMPHIFESLYTTKEYGMGLGLAGCKNIVQAHGGTIAARNSPVTFTISLPRKAKLV